MQCQVKVLPPMGPLKLDDVVIGLYKSQTKGGVTYPAYTDDKTLSKDSKTPTFAAAALFIDNSRWDGVPFLMKTGKPLHNRRLVLSIAHTKTILILFSKMHFCPFSPFLVPCQG